MFSTELVGEQDLVSCISKTVAEQADCDIRDVPPMYEAIDPDALGTFLGCSDGSDARAERAIEFSYCGDPVAADSTGQVRFHPESATDTKVPIRE